MLRKTVVFLLVMSIGVTAHAQSAILRSVDTSDLNRTAKACDNFYDFANGGWRANNPIPASMDRWSRRWQAGEANKDRLRIILDDLSSAPHRAVGTPPQLAGDFYAACTNVKAVDAAGVMPLKPYIAKIAAIHDITGLQRELAALHAINIMIPFTFGGSQDIHAPTRVIADVGAGGLGLPDRDYYVKPDPRFAEARAAYLVYIAKVLTLTGLPEKEAQASARTVMRIETALAKASLDNVALRDPHATDHPSNLAGLQKMTPHFDWASFLRSANVEPGAINIDQPDFMAEFDHQLVSTPLADWKTYLHWQLINIEADALSQPFVDAHFDFYQRQLAGVGELKPRPTRCAEQTDLALGEALGQEYVKRYFPPQAKQRAQDMVMNILAAMRNVIDSVDWMSSDTRERALEKLSAFNVKVGYPDKWKDYSSVKITRENYFDDLIAARRFLVADDRSTIGKLVDRGRWGMTPPTSNAYYNPTMNEIVFPAGILQPPAFSVDYVDAVNYGAIGVVIGHEISHGFDDQGAQFDAQGKLDDWWAAKDLEKFRSRTACVVKQFNQFPIDGDPSIHINGNLVLGESIGDLGGVKIAYLAFKKTPQGQSDVAIDGFSPDQQFFIAWGQFRGDETRPETQKLMVQGDPHPIAKYRVLGPLSNFPPFASAFSCKVDDRMTRSDTDRCVVW